MYLGLARVRAGLDRVSHALDNPILLDESIHGARDTRNAEQEISMHLRYACVLGRGLCSLAEVHDEAAMVEATTDGVPLAIEVGVLERDLLPSGRILDCRGLDHAHSDLCPRLRTDGVAEDVRRVDAFEALLDA